ncbi:MAG: response regulator, partial [Alphaproteobacteria bacterium]
RALGHQITELMQALRVLIVEDDPLIADLLAGLPEALGATVARAETLGQAEMLWHEFMPDVLIVDGWLGDQSSADWLMSCLLERPNVRAVLTTADLSMRPVGVSWVLEKPFEPSDATRLLRGALNEVLAGKILGEDRVLYQGERSSPAVHE